MLDLPAWQRSLTPTFGVPAPGQYRARPEDFIVDEQLNLVILEANTMPGFTSHSLMPKAAKHFGITFPDLCDHLARLALR